MLQELHLHAYYSYAAWASQRVDNVYCLVAVFITLFFVLVGFFLGGPMLIITMMIMSFADGQVHCIVKAKVFYLFFK